MQSFVEILAADRNNAVGTPSFQILVGHELGEDPTSAEVEEEIKPGSEESLDEPAQRTITEKIEFSPAIDTNMDPNSVLVKNNRDLLTLQLARP